VSTPGQGGAPQAETRRAFWRSNLDLHRPGGGREDGVLVALVGPGGINRVTRAVFDHFAEVMGQGVTNITPLIRAMEYMVSVEIDGGWRTANYRGKALWLIPNEIRSFTLMFPEDY
jgi:hypothetical protein